jgi:hypothetical protein
METYWVSTQKSADGIVLPVIRREGLNVEMSGASNEFDVGVESVRMSQASARHGIASLDSFSVRIVVLIVDSDLIRLRPDDFHEPPTADPHGGCCGEGRLITVPYPITRFTIFCIRKFQNSTGHRKNCSDE